MSSAKNQNQKPKKWTEVYPYGTNEGAEEAKVFRALARHPKWSWRSVASIMSETGLTRQRVEEIINKYAKKCNPPLIYGKSASDGTNWAYWERVPEVLEKDERKISTKDKDNRIDSQMADFVGNLSSAGVKN